MNTDTPRTEAFMESLQGYSDSWETFAQKVEDFCLTLERELNALRWIPITERLPTIEDGDQFEDVEWSDGKSIREGNYKHSKGETHWRRITLP